MNDNICVTVCTRERPQMLSACLRSVLPQLAASPVNTSLVVVENGPNPTCRELVEALARDFRTVRVEYLQELELGIPFARNAAVEAALRHGADWIVFIDDDEQADEGWLDGILNAFGNWEADIFRGPVKFIYPDGHPEWKRMKPFDGGPTGKILKSGTTNNTAARAWLFSEDGLGLRFDTSLRFTGGSDIELFNRASRHGAVIRWVREASMHEHVSGARLTSKWHLRRTERVAANKILFMIRDAGFGVALRFAMQKSFRLAIQLALQSILIPLTVIAPRRAASETFKLRNKFARMKGYMMPILGRSLEPYRTVEGE